MTDKPKFQNVDGPPINVAGPDFEARMRAHVQPTLVSAIGHVAAIMDCTTFEVCFPFLHTLVASMQKVDPGATVNYLRALASATEDQSEENLARQNGLMLAEIRVLADRVFTQELQRQAGQEDTPKS